jgi:hypothetical protein
MTDLTEMFQPICNFLILLFAVDLALSGLLVLVVPQAILVKPILLGLKIMHWMRTSAEKSQMKNFYVNMLLNTKLMAILFLLCGLLVGSAAVSPLIHLSR